MIFWILWIIAIIVIAFTIHMKKENATSRQLDRIIRRENYYRRNEGKF